MSWPSNISTSTMQRVVDAQAQLALERSGSAGIAAWQTQRLTELVQWLLNHVPWWRERLGSSVNLQEWTRLPILSRFELRKMVVVQGAAAVPEAHGAVAPYCLAGPPGGVVRFYTSAFSQRMVDHAFYADHQRQGRNPYATHACIADDLPAHEGEHITVPASLENGMGVQVLRQQNQFTRMGHLQWLQHTRTDYLTTTPQWFEAVLNDARLHHIELPEIRQILTYGATAPSTLRTKARKQLGASVRHRYTCLECGPLAFQCPRSDDFYHVAVANVLLEVVDAAGQPCPIAGDPSTAQTGRVLVTALHQYATPLLRHDIGDRAALLNHCPGCGLDLPTLCRLLQNV